MNCEKYQELISCLIDGELSQQERAQLENHIAHCPECKAMYEDFAALSGMVEDSMAQVPDSLHEKIMSGVKAAKKVKKPLIVRLRPYMATAACLVVIVGAVFALRDGVGYDMAAKSTAAAAPGAAADCSLPASKPEESEGFDFYGASSATGATDDASSLETAEDSAETPMEMAPDMPADKPAEAPAAQPESPMVNETDRCENSNSSIFSYQDIFTRSIDSALLTTLMTDGNTKKASITDLEALTKALEPLDFYEDTDFNTSALLELKCGSETFILELYYAGDALIVRHGGEYWVASASVEEFLYIK